MIRAKMINSFNRKLVTIKHKFLDHAIDPATETLIIGTFNPGHECNKKVDFFYGGDRNRLWTLLPKACGDCRDLSKASRDDKIAFTRDKRIDFIDIISEVQVSEGEECNRNDRYIDARVTQWRDVIGEMQQLARLKRACFTRRTVSDIPNVKLRIENVRTYCRDRGVVFKCIVTPSQAYRSEDKQPEWTSFFSA
jgi:G:T/U-mismatch repair DNA glycosylase